MAADPTRRAMLAATAVLPLLVAGCKGAQALGTPPLPAPDVTQLRSAIAAEQQLIARYRAVIKLSGGSQDVSATTRQLLAEVLAEHQDHLGRLRASLVPGSPLAAGSGPLHEPSPPALPPSAAQAAADLATAEQAASGWLLDQVGKVPPTLAQLMASIGASEATHAAALRRALAQR
jgi:hypothetical protein